MNTPNNLEWLDPAINSLMFDYDVAINSSLAKQVAISTFKQTIATKLSEAYKQGGVDELKKVASNNNSLETSDYIVSRIATLTNDKEQE